MHINDPPVKTMDLKVFILLGELKSSAIFYYNKGLLLIKRIYTYISSSTDRSTRDKLETDLCNKPMTYDNKKTPLHAVRRNTIFQK